MNENIIAINIPNAISIIIMAAGGALLIAFLRKATGTKGAGAGQITTGAAFTNG